MRSRARLGLAGPTASPQGQSFRAPPPRPGEQCCAPKTRTWRRGRRPCAGCSLPGAQRPPCAPGRGTRAFPSGGAALAAGSWVCTRVGACGDGCALGATIELRCARESGACPPPRAPARLPAGTSHPSPDAAAVGLSPPFPGPSPRVPVPAALWATGRAHTGSTRRGPRVSLARRRQQDSAGSRAQGGAGGAGLRAGRRGSRCALSARRRSPQRPVAAQRSRGAAGAAGAVLLCQQKAGGRKGRLRFAWVSSEPGAEIDVRRGPGRERRPRSRRAAVQREGGAGGVPSQPSSAPHPLPVHCPPRPLNPGPRLLPCCPARVPPTSAASVYPPCPWLNPQETHGGPTARLRG